eukprot:Colp12_sorted_trinity150504_noHs@9946
MYLFVLCMGHAECVQEYILNTHVHQRPAALQIFLVYCTHLRKCSCSYISHFLSFFYSISTPDSIGQEIEKKCQSIFPLQNVFIRKVKVLKKPKFDLLKLMEVHGDSAEDTGAALDKIAAANTVKALKGAGGRL